MMYKRGTMPLQDSIDNGSTPHYSQHVLPQTSAPHGTQLMAMAKDNGPGYKILDGVAPTDEMLAAAKAEISTDTLEKFQQSFSSVGAEGLGWGRNCEALFYEGLNVSCNLRFEVETSLTG